MDIDETTESAPSMEQTETLPQHTYTPSFEDSTEQKQKETKRKHEQTKGDEEAIIEEDQEPSEKRPKIVSDAAVHKLIEVITDEKKTK